MADIKPSRICPFKMEALMRSGDFFNVPVVARNKACLCIREECMHYKVYGINDDNRCHRKISMCEFNDAGWCYHHMGPDNGCPGTDNCPIIADSTDIIHYVGVDVEEEIREILRHELLEEINKANETGRTAETHEEHPQADAEAFSCHQKPEES